MPLYHFHPKNEETGAQSWMEMVDTDYSGDQKNVPTPGGADLPDISHKLWLCDVQDCGKQFRTAGLASKHFNQKHLDLKESPESWREHVSVAQVLKK